MNNKIAILVNTAAILIVLQCLSCTTNRPNDLLFVWGNIDFRGEQLSVSLELSDTVVSKADFLAWNSCMTDSATFWVRDDSCLSTGPSVELTLHSNAVFDFMVPVNGLDCKTGDNRGGTAIEFRIWKSNLVIEELLTWYLPGEWDGPAYQLDTLPALGSLSYIEKFDLFDRIILRDKHVLPLGEYQMSVVFTNPYFTANGPLCWIGQVESDTIQFTLTE